MSVKGEGKLVANQKVTGKALPVSAGLGVGVGVSMVLTVLLSAVSAYLQGREVLGESGIGYCVMITLLVSSLLGAMTAAGKIKHMRAVMCMGAGVGYFLILMALTALFFGGQYTGVGVTALVILGGSAAAAFFSKTRKRSTSVRVRKYKNR